jgi:cell division protein FtsI/penicillin-binding protein 2
MKKRIWIFFFLGVLAAACNSTPTTAPTPTETPRPSLPPPGVTTTRVPDARAAASDYLAAWKAEDYASMYSLLSQASKSGRSEADFAKHYQDITIEAALSGVDTAILSTNVDPGAARVDYQVTLHSALVGDIPAETSMNLVMEQGQWKVVWDDTLVLPDLGGGNYLKMDQEGYIPERANIYDRNGNPLAAPAEATAIGMRPDLINPDTSDKFYGAMSRVTGIPVENLVRMAENAYEGDYISLGEVLTDYLDRRGSVLYGMDGAYLTPYTSRFYFNEEAGSHLIGYVGQIQAADLQAYQRKGYQKDELVGQSGLEKWGEPYLAGKRGGELLVNDDHDQPVRKLAEAPSEPSQAIYTTLDSDFEAGIQKALEGFSGAIVVLERDTGRVLAMASSPSFDPNAFAPGNFNSYSELAALSDSSQPLFNRATQGQYPLGSVFKLVTIAAALESGVYTPETTYQCGYFFDELPGLTLHDWTYDHFEQDGTTQPSGLLTLPQGLIRSCNPFFWHIGLDLYRQGLTTAISDMAKGYGLGSKTGIEVVDEQPGNIPEPGNEVDAVNLAIGQGDTLVTPLQVADFVAAIGNGGTLYVPQVVEKIERPDGTLTSSFQPKVRGQLPVSPENLKVIQDAMTGVVTSDRPRGTAVHVFRGLNIQLAGKTGTATSSGALPHAWFAGYTFAGRADKPDIAIAVVVENIGEGSDYAAPIFRRVVELYFRGQPGKLYPWEQTYYVKATPQPEETETPTPEP